MDAVGNDGRRRAVPPLRPGGRVKPRDLARERGYGSRMSHEKRAEDVPIEQDAPTGGDETTEDELDADNPVEEDTIKTLEPENPPA